MNKALRFADKVDAVTRAAGRIATALLLALVALVFFNVAGRYAGGGAPVWAQELEWHVMAPVALLGVAVLMLEGGHVRVDMLYERMPTRMQAALDLVSMLVGVVVSLLFIKYSWGFVGSAWAIDEGSPDPGGLPARWALKAVIPIAFGLVALQCAANAIRHAARLRPR